MLDEKFMHDIDQYIDENWNNVLEDIATLVRIPSVEGEPAEGAPFGVEPHRALMKALEIAKDHGFETHDVQGYAGYAEIPGKSKRHIALIGHVDVVPAGDGWDWEPFEMNHKDGCIIGRGVLDDKGPALVGLYALKFFMNRGEQPYGLRMIFGSNEETAMAGVAKYNEVCEQPAFIFTPDAEFPVCYGEKGYFEADFASNKITDGKIIELDCGTASNAVPDLAKATVSCDLKELPAQEDFEIVPVSGGFKITAHGIGGHASKPKETKSAISMLTGYLLDNKLVSASEAPFLSLVHDWSTSYDGQAMGIKTTDDMFGPLTSIIGTLALEDNKFTANCNIRYISTIHGDQIIEKLTKAIETVEGSFSLIEATEAFFVDKNSKEITILCDTYNEITGSNEEPFTIGGGTYAGRFDNAASYGPIAKSQDIPEWCGSEHSANEAYPEKYLKEAMKIYIVAISRLLDLRY